MAVLTEEDDGGLAGDVNSSGVVVVSGTAVAMFSERGRGDGMSVDVGVVEVSVAEEGTTVLEVKGGAVGAVVEI